MKGKRELVTHILMVAAPFFMLAALTIAWFVNARTLGISEMSFASKDAGPGAVLYKAAETTRVSTTASQIISDIKWDEKETPENSDITIANMTPGQADYYLLVANDNFSVTYSNVKWYDDKNAELADGTEIAMAQCVAFYLIPTDVAAPITGEVSRSVSFSLSRDEATGPLSATYLKATAPTTPIPVEGATPDNPNYYKTYILAVYCDPMYGQGLDINGTPYYLDHLTGSLSFSLTFDAEK